MKVQIISEDDYLIELDGKYEINNHAIDNFSYDELRVKFLRINKFEIKDDWYLYFFKHMRTHDKNYWIAYEK
ncbi:unnamed protein product [Blepharisma stoltei]|uniref:Uncharacterized protein n=1 Tax=Blepharisma stoltei TaxID=1481888 RepID=A0AAU9ITS8_9CILI|nr:unnamed protein product [Blepharisma stoltei]